MAAKPRDLEQKSKYKKVPEWLIDDSSEDLKMKS